MKTSIKTLAIAGAALVAGLGFAAPAHAADHVSINLAFGYPQPVVHEVVVAHPQCQAHPRWRSCWNYYHAAYVRHYHGRHDPHWRAAPAHYVAHHDDHGHGDHHDHR